MSKTNLKEIKKVAEEYNNSVDLINKKIRSIQSVKSRLKKQKLKPTYETEMTEILKQEQLFKEVRQYLDPKEVTVTTMTMADIEKLTYDETVRAIKSIQSKKCLVQFSNKAEYEEAIKIEDMLKEHRELVKDVNDNLIQKSKINNVIKHLEDQDQQLDKDYVIKLLTDLL